MIGALTLTLAFVAGCREPLTFVRYAKDPCLGSDINCGSGPAPDDTTWKSNYGPGVAIERSSAADESKPVDLQATIDGLTKDNYKWLTPAEAWAKIKEMLGIQPSTDTPIKGCIETE
jgi:hypothetical protein